MAKDKTKEVEYKAEGLRRAYKRKQERKEKNKDKDFRYGRGNAECSMCGGQMSWCSCCEVWTSTCCCEYGTCQCS